MIIGIGSDICLSVRVSDLLDSFGDRFSHRIFTESERRHADTDLGKRVMRYAQMFAAKEAFGKALGTGISGGVYWRDIEVLRESSGKPYLRLHGGANEVLRGLSGLGESRPHLTLSGDGDIANAVVVLEVLG